MVASIATSPVLSITASSTGPRSLRRPTLARLTLVPAEVVTSRPTPGPAASIPTLDSRMPGRSPVVSTQARALRGSTWIVACSIANRSRSTAAASVSTTVGSAPSSQTRCTVATCMPDVRVHRCRSCTSTTAPTPRSAASASAGTMPAGACWPSTASTSRPSSTARTATNAAMASAITVSQTDEPVAATSRPATITPTEPTVSATTSR